MESVLTRKVGVAMTFDDNGPNLRTACRRSPCAYRQCVVIPPDRCFLRNAEPPGPEARAVESWRNIHRTSEDAGFSSRHRCERIVVSDNLDERNRRVERFLVGVRMACHHTDRRNHSTLSGCKQVRHLSSVGMAGNIDSLSVYFELARHALNELCEKADIIDVLGRSRRYSRR